ncbi:MAG: anhydro-N-acetylmuramic acid kinase [Proteobacteria bacterium]|nr:anhydro-N-acetylmuramic acid kinase [Pseudomonadota bacterium]
MNTAIGIMSGTSMDAIDVALVTTDGADRITTGGFRAYPMPPALRRALLAVIADPSQAEHGNLDALEREVSDAHADAAAQFLQDEGLAASAIDLVGLHGQTVFHAPQRRFTRQLGLGQRVADRLGIDVVNRFRHNDVAAGGQGAPLVPLYHQALVRAGGITGPVAVLNLGGVANITFVDGDTVLACDTGPGSALIDDFMLKRRGEAFDRDGALAASGRVDEEVLRTLMDNPFFAAPPPKSLDRNEFHRRAQAVDGLSDADGAATLTAFTVEATAAILPHLPRPPARWLVTGGGRLNASFMTRFQARFGVPVDPVDSVGWNGDALEAQCFGWLAVRSVRGLPLSLPSTTGVSEPLTGGAFSAHRRTAKPL